MIANDNNNTLCGETISCTRMCCHLYCFDLVYTTLLGSTFREIYFKTPWTVEQEIAIFAKQNPWAMDRPPSVEDFRVVVQA